MAQADSTDLVFLDETSTPTTLTLLRARAPRGQRAVGRVPRGRREAISWLATLTTRGIGESLLVRGAVDRPVFEAFVEWVLVPSLRPGQIVILNIAMSALLVCRPYRRASSIGLRGGTGARSRVCALRIEKGRYDLRWQRSAEVKALSQFATQAEKVRSLF